MYVARILYPVEVLGPGKRVGIWFCGCPRRCKGCSNPELWHFQPRYRTTPQAIYALILRIANENEIDGFTITGGDPLYQPEALAELISLLRGISEDILVYTGYRREELSDEALRGIAVLIDGEYIEERNTDCLLRGSDNQRILILEEKWKDRYERYLSSACNQIQNFMTGDGVISVGIHRPGFLGDLNEYIKRTNYGKGLDTSERKEKKD